MDARVKVRITPLSGALGAEATGVDWTGAVDGTALDEIKVAFLKFHVLCLRSDPLSHEDFAAVGRLFGEPQVQLLRKSRVDGVPGVAVFDSSYKKPEDKPGDMQSLRRSGWHTDDSYFAIPAKIILLQGLQIPDHGGETRFCNARAAYEDLSAETKTRVEGLRAVHGYDTPRALARAQERTEAEGNDTPDVEHPLIRIHDETGNKAIYFNSNRTDRIVGMDRSESDALLDEIHAHMTQTRYQYHHPWRVGDILMWDNRSVTHSVNMDFPVGQKRVHQRLLLQGSKPV